jgi:hypothetical protein
VQLSEGDYWTSGTDADCPDRFMWCSKDSHFASSQVQWKAGHPATGDCVHVQIRNGSHNATVLGTSDCGEKLNFVCEMRKRGTEADSLMSECMALWDVSDG